MSSSSIVVLQFGKSTWMLKSPSRRTDGDMAQSWVRNSDKSEGNVGFGLGGR